MIKMDVIYFLAGLSFLVWLTIKSPLLASLVKASVIIVWGLFAIIAPLYFAFALHFPKGDYLAGTLTMLVFGFFGFLWVVFCPGELKKMASDKGNFSLWSNE